MDPDNPYPRGTPEHGLDANENVRQAYGLMLVALDNYRGYAAFVRQVPAPAALSVEYTGVKGSDVIPVTRTLAFDYLEALSDEAAVTSHCEAERAIAQQQMQDAIDAKEPPDPEEKV